MCPPTISSAPQSTSRASTCVASCDGLLPRPPRRADHLVVQRDDAQRVRRAACRSFVVARVELPLADPAGLVPPRPHRVEPDDVRALARRTPARSSPTAARTRPTVVVKRAGNVYGMSWLPGIASTGDAEPPQECRRPLVLVAAAAVGQVAARDHEFGTDTLDQRARAPRSRHRVVPRAEVEIGDVQDASGHRRSRLYSGSRWPTSSRARSSTTSTSALRAGGALRKQRRGEQLTRRGARGARPLAAPLDLAQGVAIGGFAVGTFGLGFTLGGLVFGRWRKA